MTTTGFDDMTLQELLEQHPGLDPVLQALNIEADDSAMLDDVAASKGWPPRVLVDIIANANATVGSDDLLSARALGEKLRGIAIDCVRADHRLLRRDLTSLSDLASSEVAGCSEEAKGALRDLTSMFDHLQKQMLAHLIIEEQVLFPRLKRGDHRPAGGEDSTEGDSPATAVAEMEREHEMLDAMFGQMRAVMDTCDPGPEGAGVVGAINNKLALLEKDLLKHARIESDLLWPGTHIETDDAGDGDSAATTSADDATGDEACPRTGRPCEQGTSAICSEFWECVRSAMEQKWDEADEEPTSQEAS